MEKEGDPHTLARGPSVTGSKGLALGMCLASLQGLEGEGDRVPGACGGVWGEISIFQPSGSEVAATAPVGRISGVPDGEGTQDSRHMAHLLHHHESEIEATPYGGWEGDTGEAANFAIPVSDTSSAKGSFREIHFKTEDLYV